jgi:hypothetical protein
MTSKHSPEDPEADPEDEDEDELETLTRKTGSPPEVYPLKKPT